MNRQFDIIVFGAPGYTGSFLVEELVNFQGKNPSETFTWAVAGNNSFEIGEMLHELSRRTGKEYRYAERVYADALKPKSLREMASQCKVLINCVGPFRFLGENVVKACIAEGTHLIEACGEQQYLLKMQLLYNKQAEERGIYIVGSCSYGSIPVDLGTMWLEQKFPGDLNSVETFSELSDYSRKSRQGNYASYHSMIHILGHLKEWSELEKKVLSGPKFNHKYPLQDRGVLHYSQLVSSWCTLSFMCDASVVRRTQHLLYQTEKKRPVQVKQYLKLPSLIFAIVTFTLLAIYTAIAQFEFGRYLMEKFPRVFSGGCCNAGDERREVVKKLGFKITIVGTGWDKKLADASDEHRGPPNVTRRVEVSGYNPYYGGSAVMLLQSALTVLKEEDKMPGRGGVITPGAAFARTALVEKLNSNGVKFKILDDSDN